MLIASRMRDEISQEIIPNLCKVLCVKADNPCTRHKLCQCVDMSCLTSGFDAAIVHTRNWVSICMRTLVEQDTQL